MIRSIWSINAWYPFWKSPEQISFHHLLVVIPDLIQVHQVGIKTEPFGFIHLPISFQDPGDKGLFNRR